MLTFEDQDLFLEIYSCSLTTLLRKLEIQLERKVICYCPFSIAQSSVADSMRFGGRLLGSLGCRMQIGGSTLQGNYLLGCTWQLMVGVDVGAGVFWPFHP